VSRKSQLGYEPDEIAVTDAMIAAGSAALDDALFRNDYASPVGPYSREAIVREVFAAMLAARARL
jgi:hypothetical protein